MGKIKDLTNQVFGRLTVIEFAGFGSSHKTLWKCKCECGNEITVKSNSLVTGHTRSCGCLEIETKKKNNLKHGLRNDPLYPTWLNMRDRCNNPNNSHYKYYGKKGICLCEEWDDFKNFYNWAYSNGYVKGLTIERIDINSNYCPENCKWISMKDQARNKSNTLHVEFGGKMITIPEISEITGIKTSTLYSRVRRTGTIYLKNGKI